LQTFSVYHFFTSQTGRGNRWVCETRKSLQSKLQRFLGDGCNGKSSQTIVLMQAANNQLRVRTVEALDAIAACILLFSSGYHVNMSYISYDELYDIVPLIFATIL
jgi:hypothetical protein